MKLATVISKTAPLLIRNRNLRFGVQYIRQRIFVRPLKRADRGRNNCASIKPNFRELVLRLAEQVYEYTLLCRYLFDSRQVV
jgi:hypothetical protein